MYDYIEAPGDVIKARNELADQVCRDLELAGIPAFRQEGSPWDRAGAVVEANPSGDAAGGVFVEWNPHPTVSQAVADSVQSGEFPAKVIQHSGVISSCMRDAIIGILESAGFQADAADDDMRPMAVRVATG
ncbi:hypothetical protein [Streptomyces flaveus]|uniref:hypothetical protein n=1 Tax=Streptomyces flaveus TaxID=66370 RepID=UPI0016711231|nr:hypothetical protein [Streptomyces flaveus]